LRWADPPAGGGLSVRKINSGKVYDNIFKITDSPTPAFVFAVFSFYFSVLNLSDSSRHEENQRTQK
jgi:hypothetical protein